MQKEKYCGIIPAFYACYREDGTVNPSAVEEVTDHLIAKGVTGLYVGGSSGECIYQSVAERKLVLEHVMKRAKGKITVIAHVAANNTADSMELAAHAEALGVDAIAAIPPIYFHLPEEAIAQYWNDISSAAPNTDFIIYNIPQLAGVALTQSCLRTMQKNPRLMGVKNSSMPTLDIQVFKAMGGDDLVVFNGPDEQLVSGLAIGAEGGIGGTYVVMPEVYVKIKELLDECNLKQDTLLQSKANEIIFSMCSCKGNLYAVMKEIIKIREGIDLGSVRRPLPPLAPEDTDKVKACAAMIDTLIQAL
ncbi:MAG: dihydrodipicolinate synthase family protein [Clostridia bacterium]|nr:dihydrodipicolinate synthase family protein [Clostridia bacterium]